MRLRSSLGLCLALAFASGSAFGFEEQQAPIPGASGTPAAVAPAAGVELNSGAAVEKPSAGTEVRIPGLGKLGMLPKMDFGLELLYGANDQKPGEAEDQAPTDDVTIRGSVKHKF